MQNSAPERNKVKEKDINDQIKLTTFSLQTIICQSLFSEK